MFRFMLIRPDGSPNDPPEFVSSEPSGHWHVGDVFYSPGAEEFRILEIAHPTSGYPSGYSAEIHGLWTVEPV